MYNKYKDLSKITIRKFLEKYEFYNEKDEKVKFKVLKEFQKFYSDDINLDQYRDVLWQMISDKVIMFNREMLIYIAEFIREMVCMNSFPKEHLDTMMEINEIAIIMQKAIFTNWERFSKKDWYINSGYLCELRELLYLYKIMIQNIEYAKINNIKISYKNLFEIVNDDEISNYFTEYDKYFKELKLEQETIIDDELNEYLHGRKLLPKQIRKSANYAVESTLGFNYDDLASLKNHINVLQQYETLNHHYCIEKTEFCNIFSDFIDVDKVGSIVKYLSINQLFLRKQNPSMREIELRCISEQDENIYFGLYNLLECINIFENIGFSGHYIKELGISESEKSKFSKLQARFSSFFSYKVADLLNYNGYILPKKDGIIQAEICEIEISYNEILKFKDIDVLAVDIQNSILYNFELKYFKLDLAYKKIKKDKFDEQLFNSFMKRNKVLEDNKDKILKNLFGINNTEEYKVKPVLISSRVNYRSRKEISYYTFESLKEKLRLKELL